MHGHDVNEFQQITNDKALLVQSPINRVAFITAKLFNSTAIQWKLEIDYALFIKDPKIHEKKTHS